jgi:hypothetical protein
MALRNKGKGGQGKGKRRVGKKTIEIKEKYWQD